MQPLHSRVLRCLVALVALMSLAGDADAHGYKKKSIAIVHPWTSASFEQGTRDSIVGMDLRNSGKQADRLLSATSKIAARVELRADAVSLASSPVPVPPNGTITLSRKGAHLRLIGLTKALVAYDTLAVELVFEKAGRVVVDVLVEEATAAAN